MFSKLSMWIALKAKDLIFEKVFTESCSPHAEPELSHSIRNELQSFSIDVRKEIVSRAKEGRTPLLSACERGNLKIVEYLIEHCDADIEQSFPGGTFLTPLWFASSSANLSVVRCLVRHGANVNIASDTGLTLVNHISYKNFYHIVKCLIENNADILRPNHCGVTCLMNSIKCLPLSELLIQHGADVNAQSIHLFTALHLAISESRFSVMELLLENGADPFLKDKHGNDALQTACLEMNIPAVEYLCKNCSYSRKRIAEAHELIGSTYLERDNQHMCLHHWHVALSIRYTENPTEAIPKTLASKVPYAHIPEFNSVEELKNISMNLDIMYTQSLLVRERILGSSHINTIYYLKSRANYYLQGSQYKSFINLKIYALKLSIQNSTLLDTDVCSDAKYLALRFLCMHEAYQNGMVHAQIEFHDVFELMNMLTCQLESCNSLLAVKPVFKTQQDIYDIVLMVLTHLIYVLCVIPKTPEQVITMQKFIRKILLMEPRTSEGDTLLHIVVSKSNLTRPSIFPDAAVLELLLECGASVAMVNQNLSTPLHTAALPFNFTPEVIDLLLRYGAHIDQRNDAGNSPRSMLPKLSKYNIDYLQFTTLKCLAACKIMEKQIPFIGEVPLVLEEFIRIH